MIPHRNIFLGRANTCLKGYHCEKEVNFIFWKKKCTCVEREREGERDVLFSTLENHISFGNGQFS